MAISFPKSAPLPPLSGDAFYIVWSPTGPTPPRVRHEHYVEALAEAERLAHTKPSETFFVMCAQVVCRAPLPAIERKTLDDQLPF